jgi:D-alanyl-lipoteichoic acid acyltransferase DltB (MBOAT superfamily)
MAGASLSFLAFGAVVILLCNLLDRPAWRQFLLLAASAVFLWMCAEGESLIPLLAFVGLGYAGLKLVESGRMRSAAPMIVVTLLIFVWLKKYTFLPSFLFLQHPYTTLGLSYILFRVIHLMADAHSGELAGPVGLASYLTYTLNFTSLIAGPIQRYQEFDRTCQESRRPSVIRAGQAIERIIVGFFKANVLALAFSMLKSGAINQLTTAAHWDTRVLAGAVVVASYPFFLYCNFSGYIDIVIGLARLIGITLPENFDRPFSADSFIGFWSRWHITLSTWLKIYVYNPLLMALMRRFPALSLAPVWGVSAFFVTFFLVGAWHGQTPAFLFFGVLQGLGVSMNKLYEIVVAKKLGRKRTMALMSNGPYIAICRGLTFTWFAFTLMWFWGDWTQLAKLEASVGAAGAAAALLLILIAAIAGLALWEAARNVFLKGEWQAQVILQSRYVRTAWCTVLVLISTAAELLLQQQAPEIVYKTF